MSSDNENEVRVNVLLDRERNDVLNKLLPWGAKSTILRNIVEKVIDGLMEDADGDFYSMLVKDQFAIVKKKP